MGMIWINTISKYNRNCQNIWLSSSKHIYKNTFNSRYIAVLYKTILLTARQLQSQYRGQSSQIIIDNQISYGASYMTYLWGNERKISRVHCSLETHLRLAKYRFWKWMIHSSICHYSLYKVYVPYWHFLLSPIYRGPSRCKDVDLSE